MSICESSESKGAREGAREQPEDRAPSLMRAGSCSKSSSLPSHFGEGDTKLAGVTGMAVCKKIKRCPQPLQVANFERVAEDLMCARKTKATGESEICSQKREELLTVCNSYAELIKQS